MTQEDFAKHIAVSVRVTYRLWNVRHPLWHSRSSVPIRDPVLHPRRERSRRRSHFVFSGSARLSPTHAGADRPNTSREESHWCLWGFALTPRWLRWWAERRNVAILDAVIAGLCILSVTPLLSLGMTDIRSIYPAYLVWGRAVVRLAIAAFL